MNVAERGLKVILFQYALSREGSKVEEREAVSVSTGEKAVV